MQFAKYQALGNDYLVVDLEAAAGFDLPALALAMCRAHYGVGADGLLVGAGGSQGFHLRIFNPDGSEAEKSGNGLRIFAAYLHDRARVTGAPFSVQTLGGTVTCRVHPGGRAATVEMGRASFHSRAIPVEGPDREVVDETLEAGEESLRYCAVTVGNPHCVVLRPAKPDDAHRLGPLIENLPRFPHRTNVQFLQPIDESNIQIEIWERGAGYTLASGSSSCAAASAAHRLGLCGHQVAVHMPGGTIRVEIGPDFELTMTGAVEPVFTGELSDELLATIQR